eukprot:COSAG02_NODE_26978_length_619_cov_1.998077_1_plen_31_part_01
MKIQLQLWRVLIGQLTFYRATLLPSMLLDGI